MNIFVKMVCISFFVFSCTIQKSILVTERTQLKLIGTYEIANGKVFQNTTIGGLSGIEYDEKNRIYYLISDDRSAMNPARFYTAKIWITQKGIDSIQFLSVHNLLQPDGNIYPDAKKDPLHTPDPESIRYNPGNKHLVWSSEGERKVRSGLAVLEDPSINIISTKGNYIDSFVLPANMHMQASEKGPRQNGTFEGLSFVKNYKKLLVSVEEPLFEDGWRAGLNDSSAWIRIIRFDVKTRKPEKQMGYQIDPVSHPATPPGAFKINGVPEILALNKQQLFVVERSFSSGRKPSTIKVYVANTRKAEDISSMPSLKGGSFRSIQKRLLLNMDDLGIYTDNVEGVSFGPKLRNGNSTLIFVSDNNFSKDQITQLFLFEIK